MKFLADENFPGPTLRALRDIGLDVRWISEGSSGLTDDAVLALCIAQKRILLTFDKDFGELAFHRGFPAACGVVLFRIIPQNPEEITKIALSAIASQPDWTGYFSVVTNRNIRMRPLRSSRKG